MHNLTVGFHSEQFVPNFQISGKKKKKLNRKSSWDGKVMISFGDDGQDGIKLGKCIRLQHEGVKRITGIEKLTSKCPSQVGTILRVFKILNEFMV